MSMRRPIIVKKLSTRCANVHLLFRKHSKRTVRHLFSWSSLWQTERWVHKSEHLFAQKVGIERILVGSVALNCLTLSPPRECQLALTQILLCLMPDDFTRQWGTLGLERVNIIKNQKLPQFNPFPPVSAN